MDQIAKGIFVTVQFVVDERRQSLSVRASLMKKKEQKNERTNERMRQTGNWFRKCVGNFELSKWNSLENSSPELAWHVTQYTTMNNRDKMYSLGNINNAFETKYFVRILAFVKSFGGFSLTAQLQRCLAFVSARRIGIFIMKSTTYSRYMSFLIPHGHRDHPKVSYSQPSAHDLRTSKTKSIVSIATTTANKYAFGTHKKSMTTTGECNRTTNRRQLSSV